MVFDVLDATNLLRSSEHANRRLLSIVERVQLSRASAQPTFWQSQPWPVVELVATTKIEERLIERAATAARVVVASIVPVR